MYTEGVHYKCPQKVDGKDRMKSKTEIASLLKEKRGDRSREDIAKALNISVSAVAMYEQGERIPRDEIKEQYAKLFKTTVDKLFF